METTLRLWEQGEREVSERVKTKLNESTLISYYKLHGQLYTQLFCLKMCYKRGFVCLMNFNDRLCIHPEQLADHAQCSQPKLSYVYDAPVDICVTPSPQKQLPGRVYANVEMRMWKDGLPHKLRYRFSYTTC